MKERILKIQRTIAELENPYPDDNLIGCYKDFLKVREVLPYYKFNPVVFQSLVALTCELWSTSKRISRTSLLLTIKRYGFKKDAPRNVLELSARKNLFSLFRNCFEKQEFLKNPYNEVKTLCNFTLINTPLSSDEEQWLCDNVNESPMILNRVLRYPVKSQVISQWALAHFNDDNLRERRAELTSWLIDENPDFEIDKQTLIDDFEFLNLTDIKAIAEYENEVEASEFVDRELQGILPFQRLPAYDFDGTDVSRKYVSSALSIKLKKRFYAVPIDISKDYSDNIPDFERLRNSFYSNIATTFKITMLWAIAYSRIDAKQKSELMKKYYSEESYWSFFKICKKYKFIDLLKWLEQQQ